MNELLNFCLDQLDLAQAPPLATVVALSLPSASQHDAAGVMRKIFSKLSPGSRYWGGKCLALSSLLCSAERPPIRSRFETFEGSLPQSIFARERRFSRKVSGQIAFLASLMALYVSTNCCQMDGGRSSRLPSLAISSGCRSLTDITFRPTQSAK